MPRVIAQETETYFEENDVVARWISDNTTKGGKTARSELYKNYKTWCEQNEENVDSAKEFYSTLVMKRYSISKGGKRYVSGIQTSGSSNAD